MVAERHGEMAEYMQRFGEQPAELSGEERILLSAVYENAVGSRRAAWGIITIVEHEGETKGDEQEAVNAREYAVKVEAGLQKISDGIFALMDQDLIPSESTGEPKVFHYKMKGDYYRYLAAFATRDAGRQVPMNQKVQKTVDVPQVQYMDKIVGVPSVMQRQVSSILIVQETVEVPQVQFPGRVVDAPVVMQRQVSCPSQDRIQECTIEATIDVPIPQMMEKTIEFVKVDGSRTIAMETALSDRVSDVVKRIPMSACCNKVMCT